MPKKQFEQNLDSNYIQFRIKPGEKREIFDYAVNHGFDNISSFVKNVIFEKIRGTQEEVKEEQFKLLTEQIKLQNERLEKQSYLLEELIPSILETDKKIKEVEDSKDE